MDIRENCMNEWMDKKSEMYEWKGKRENRWVNMNRQKIEFEWVNGQKRELNESVNGQKSELNEWIDEWIDECMSEWILSID